MYRQILCAVLLLIGTYRVSGQADLKHSFTSDKQSLEDKALFLADALVRHPTTFRKILKVIDAGWPLLDIGIDEHRVYLMRDYFLDRLPQLLNASNSIGILHILTDELNRVNISDVTAEFQRKKLTINSPEARGELLSAILSRFDKIRTLRRVLSHSSLRNYLPLNQTDDVSAACYNDMMDFIDAIPGVQHSPRGDLNYTTVHWAMQMLDSYGKPPSGILEGDLDWKGSVEECGKVHAHLDIGVIIGNRSLTAPVTFRGKYCHVKFSLEPTIVSFLSKTNLDFLSWGMCVPDTCSSHDVTNIFQLAIFQHFTICAGTNGSINSYEWQHCIFSKFDADKNSIISKQEWSALDGRDTSARYFLQMDINHDLQIDSADLDYFFKIFNNNGDGKIDEQEFAFNWKSLFWTVPPNQVSTQENTRYLVTSPVLYQAFNSCDSNGRGLNKDKWIHCFFAKFDSDTKHGTINKEDWQHSMDFRPSMARYFLLLDVNKDAKIDSTDLTYLFSIFDDNSDGLITLQEFTWNWKSIMWY